MVIALLAGSYLVLNQTILPEPGSVPLQLAAEPMAIQDLLTLYTMLAGISDPIRKLANVHSKIQRAAAAADRICALMDRSPKVSDRKRAVPLPRHRQTIEFDHVTFSYTEGSPVLHGINLTVRHGETIALVGPNGCGKTTLMNLLPRFWDVDSGAIRIDGHDIRDVQLRSLRRQIGMVIQETILFQDTIANNIAYGYPHARRPAIVAAAERAYAHQFIMSLPQGYDTLIGERGHGLSGGQRQRLALARAMLRDPAILILDEATSAVDIQDEVLIRKAIEEFAKKRTTLLDLSQPGVDPVRRPDRPDQRGTHRSRRHRPRAEAVLGPLPPASRDSLPPRHRLIPPRRMVSTGLALPSTPHIPRNELVSRMTESIVVVTIRINPSCKHPRICPVPSTRSLKAGANSGWALAGVACTQPSQHRVAALGSAHRLEGDWRWKRTRSMRIRVHERVRGCGCLVGARDR